MNSLTRVTASLLKQFNIKFTIFGLEEALYNHPDYPSILSISDVLKDKYHILNAALKVEHDKLDQIPLPFIALINDGSDKLVSVEQCLADKIILTNDKGRRESVSKELFKEQWGGTVLIAEKSNKSIETNYKEHKQTEVSKRLRLPAFVALALTGLVTIILINKDLPLNSLIWLSISSLLLIIGTVLCSLLLWYEIDKNNPLLQNICTGIVKTNCDAVLNSKASKFLGLISWSEIGFFYFSGNLLFLLIAASAKSNGLFPILFWVNILALPYTIFSIVYQWKIAKQWCVLCLAVQSVLILSFSNNLFFKSTSTINFSINLLLLFQLGISFFAPIILWFIAKPVFLKLQDAKRKNRQLLRLKFDKRIFNALLSKQKQLSPYPMGLGITIGPPDAENTIVKVCNPYCGPCAKAHPDIEKILSENPNIKAQIIFTATADEVDKRSKPVKHLMAIASKGDMTLTSSALDDWYLATIKDYDAFALKYPMNGELKMQDQKLKEMHKWCDEIGIEFTPTFFINGRQLPELYTVKDIAYFLSE